MSIRVEFYGIARERAGTAAVQVDPGDLPATLRGVLNELERRVPGFGRDCLDDGNLHTTLAANLDGERFVTDPATVIHDGQSLLILSADAGG